MKVLIDARLYGLENAGLGRYTVELVKQLSINHNEFNYVIFLRKKYFNKLKLPSNWKKVCVDIRHYSFSEQFLLPLLLYKENPDLVHFVHFNVPFFYFGKFVVTIHDLLMHNFSIQSTTLPPLLYFIKRVGYHVTFRKAIRSSSIIITPSLAVKREILDLFNVDDSKVITLYEGVSNKFTLDDLTDGAIPRKYGINKDYLLYCGNAYPHKNLDFVLETISSFNFERDFLLVLVLPRSLFRERIEKRVSDFGLQNRVKILNFVSDRDLFSLMRNSLAYVFPSLSEGFGLPGLEALSAGTILVASDIPVFREVYKDVPLYFDPRKRLSLKRSLDKVFTMTNKERQALIDKGRELASSYSWVRMVRGIADIYSRFLDM